jgi:hypothetical protein
MISLKMGVIIAAAFIAGAFVASPELRAYAANTVGSSDIIDGQVKTADLGSNAVTAAKIKDGEVKAAEIATDAVGGSELIGATKLLFGQCATDSTEANRMVPAGLELTVVCTINGVDSDDSVVASENNGNYFCFDLRETLPQANQVLLRLVNECTFTTQFGSGTFGIMVFDK